MPRRRNLFQRIPSEVAIPGIFLHMPMSDIIATLRTNKNIYNKYLTLYDWIYEIINTFSGRDLIEDPSFPGEFKQRLLDYQRSAESYDHTKTYLANEFRKDLPNALAELMLSIQPSENGYFHDYNLMNRANYYSIQRFIESFTIPELYKIMGWELNLPTL